MMIEAFNFTNYFLSTATQNIMLHKGLASKKKHRPFAFIYIEFLLLIQLRFATPISACDTFNKNERVRA
jgi:hypothetical protein